MFGCWQHSDCFDCRQLHSCGKSDRKCQLHRRPASYANDSCRRRRAKPELRFSTFTFGGWHGFCERYGWCFGQHRDVHLDHAVGLHGCRHHGNCFDCWQLCDCSKSGWHGELLRSATSYTNHSCWCRRAKPELRFSTFTFGGWHGFCERYGWCFGQHRDVHLDHAVGLHGCRHHGNCFDCWQLCDCSKSGWHGELLRSATSYTNHSCWCRRTKRQLRFGSFTFGGWHGFSERYGWCFGQHRDVLLDHTAGLFGCWQHRVGFDRWQLRDRSQSSWQCQLQRSSASYTNHSCWCRCTKPELRFGAFTFGGWHGVGECNGWCVWQHRYVHFDHAAGLFGCWKHGDCFDCR